MTSRPTSQLALDLSFKPSPQVISKARVSQHGEVMTAHREVVAMLDLVKNETSRIESRFLEPACGNGNFLHEILRRKLEVAEDIHGGSIEEFEELAILAVSRIYGIDIQDDNVKQSRVRLLELVDETYAHLFPSADRVHFMLCVRHVLEMNILCGNTLTLLSNGKDSASEVFTDWMPVDGSLMKRAEFLRSAAR